MEIDELGCGWHKSYEGKVDKVGDFFTMPPKDDLDKYESMLAEAYLVVLLHTVVSDGGGATGGGVGGGQGEQDLEEDYRVVRTRLDVCVSLQPDNPAVYKMRADMLQRFGHLASKQELVADFEQAIRLAEDDDSGKRLRCDGVDPKQQRAFLIAYCAHQLGGLQHRLKETDAAYEAYKKAVKYADPAFVNLADAHFSLCILAIMRARRAEHVDRPAGMLEAMQHYKQGLKAEKEALKYLPHVQTNVSKNLAKVRRRRGEARVRARAVTSAAVTCWCFGAQTATGAPQALCQVMTCRR